MEKLGQEEIRVSEKPWPSQRTLTLPSRKMYILLHFIIEGPRKIVLSQSEAESMLMTALRQTYGAVGSAFDFLIINFDKTKNTMILRCDKKNSLQIQTASTLLTEHQNRMCRIEILLSSPFLVSLANNSREFVQNLPQFSQ